MPVKESQLCEGIRWIDIASPARDEVEKLNQDYGFQHHLLHDCLDADQLLPKYVDFKTFQFLLVRYYNHSIDKRMATIQELTSKIALFYTDDVVITIHREELHFLHEIKVKCEANDVITIHSLIAKIMWQAIHSFEEPAMRLSEQVDFYESHIFLKNTDPSQLEALYFIKQKASLCQRLLVMTLEPLNRIKAAPDDETEMADVRDQHLKIVTLYNAVLDDVNNLMNIYMSLSAQKTNDVMKILTIFSVFFLPLTFIAGIYGMNFSYMPELKERWGYPAVWALMAVVITVIYIWFKRKKWL
jgi:magnesium transporter